jgi:CRP-like cAMP-binding protein
MIDQVIKDGFLKVWNELIGQSVLYQYHKDQVLFYEGHLPYGIFIIVSGKVNLVCNDRETQEKGSSTPLYHPIGFDILLSQQHYPFTAIAQNDVKAVFIAKSCLRKLCQPCKPVAKGKK